MYVVIFRAKIKHFDDEYSRTATALRELALAHYGCREFMSFAENGEEVAISWWDSQEQILSWKKDPQHAAAQRKGRTDWYENISVQVLEVLREYT